MEYDFDRCFAIVHGMLSLSVGDVVRKAESMGMCELREFVDKQGNVIEKTPLHFINAKAETRALKRSIDVLFGSVINFYVANYITQR